MFDPFTATADEAGTTVAAALRVRLPGRSWKQIRQLVADRRVALDGNLCTDPARRLKEGERVEYLARPVPLPRAATETGLSVRHLDEDVVVVEKPAGIPTVRHPAELDWSERRKRESPTLQDLVTAAVMRRTGVPATQQPRLRIVQRLDKDTSGLVVFARSVRAERHLGRQFKEHTVGRRYVAVVPGWLPPQRIASRLVRDRGDGRRGSTTLPKVGKEAVTHVRPLERLGPYTLVECRLETGRTHQIRIHLSEAGHPICGDKVYSHRPDGAVVPDASGAPRLALHAAELGFLHPADDRPVAWEMDPPAELRRFIDALRAGAGDGRGR